MTNVILANTKQLACSIFLTYAYEQLGNKVKHKYQLSYINYTVEKYNVEYMIYNIDPNNTNENSKIELDQIDFLDR